MTQPPNQPPTTWLGKFRCAFRGLGHALRTERSFRVHLATAAAVVIAAALLRVSLVEWCLLLGCVGLVLIAEVFNTAIERLARAITDHESQHIRDALDTSSGAVLLVSIVAAIIGAAIFLHRVAVLAWYWGE